MKTFLYFKRVTLPANGAAVPMDVSGAFFRCIEASAGRFEMSFDGQQFFEFEKGLRFRLVQDDSFPKLWFRILAGTAVANTIGFFYGTAEVDDNRLNIVNDPATSTIITAGAATYAIGGNATLLDGTFVDIPGTNDGHQRKRIHIWNTRDDQELHLFVNFPPEWAGVVSKAHPPVELETNANIRLSNNSGSNITAVWLELYYTNAFAT